MGSTVCDAVAGDPDLELVAAIDPKASGTVHGIDIAPTIEALFDTDAEVAVDFTDAAGARENLRWLAEQGIHAVVGTTGMTPEDLDEIGDWFGDGRANCILAPNFAIGAVLMMKFAAEAARWFETAEIIELHHDQKIDAPSGTAMRTAQLMEEARAADGAGEWAADPTTKVVADGARGGVAGGIHVHAVRMRGMFAHQEVILGTTGQTLILRHDTFGRDCYMPGVLLAVKQVASRPGLTVGLDALLG
jgi:4-hydroxy-tetrahydrodipicolinate reductase